MNHSILFNNGEATESELVLTIGQLNFKPDFSIFIPTFNRPYLLKEALESALNQNYNGNYEIVIIDNCSDEENFEIVKDYIFGLNLKKNKSISLYRCLTHSNSWNMGMLKSISDWVVMLHDDDLLVDKHLYEVHKCISLNREIKLLCSDSYNLIQTTQLSVLNKLFMFFKEFIKKFKNNRIIKLNVFDFYFHNPASNTGVVINRKIALEQGGFNFFKDSPIPDYAFFYRLTRDFNSTYYLNTKLSKIRFAVNDGLRKEVIQNVRVKSDRIRQDILFNNPNFKDNDYRFRDFTLKLNEIEQSLDISYLERYIKIPFFKVYTRVVSLFVFYKSISS